MLSRCVRCKLIALGQQPGPIPAGRSAYQKLLTVLQQGFKLKHPDKGPQFSHEFRSLLLGKKLPDQVLHDDRELRQQFDDPNPNQKWRGGTSKDSFNYLLLDPRVTKNLPSRAEQVSEADALRIFAGAVFYIGKGKTSRPYAHLKEASRSGKSSAKIAHIHAVWGSGLGVISLQVFHNAMTCEALTREACMIDALGCAHLANSVRGKRYGVAAAWEEPRARRYGAFLLLSAMQILLVEGERQIRPYQVSSSAKQRP